MIPVYALEAVDRGLALLPQHMDTPAARVMLLSIGLQESRFTASRQMPVGPARGFWQFERGGGVVGVLTHRSSRGLAAGICAARGVAANAPAAWAAVEHDDTLAAVFARLLLFTDPAPLPAVGASGEAWAYYIRTWRPGKPHISTWPHLYAAAQGAVGG